MGGAQWGELLTELFLKLSVSSKSTDQAINALQYFLLGERKTSSQISSEAWFVQAFDTQMWYPFYNKQQTFEGGKIFSRGQEAIPTEPSGGVFLAGLCWGKHGALDVDGLRASQPHRGLSKTWCSKAKGEGVVTSM